MREPEPEAHPVQAEEFEEPEEQYEDVLKQDSYSRFSKKKNISIIVDNGV